MAEQKSTEADAANGGAKQSKGVIALVVLACICSVLALTLTWVRNQTLNTDRYVKTVAPLATNKAIQSAVTDAITNELVKAVKPEQLVKKSLPSQAAPLAGPIAQAVQGFARTVILRLVESKQFAKLWEVISRRSHEQVVAVLTGKYTALNKVAAKGEIKLDLSPVIGPAKAILTKQGIDAAGSGGSPSIVIFNLSGIQSAQKAISALKSFTLLFTILSPLLFALAIVLSRKRRRTLITSGLALAGSMALLGIIIAVGRALYLDSLPSTVPPDAAAAFFDTLLRYFALAVRVVALIGLVVALSAWWSGNGRKAVADAGGEGLVPIARVVIIALGAVLLLSLSHPSAIGILLIVIAVAVLTLIAAPLAAKFRS
ncbi:MAG: hypothetical protein NT122_01510 [Solirubrobacterales bacterium]|nr:hypothetical protein [Solirubrobacterales bacterium]